MALAGDGLTRYQQSSDFFDKESENWIPAWKIEPWAEAVFVVISRPFDTSTSSENFILWHGNKIQMKHCPISDLSIHSMPRVRKLG